MNKIGWFTYITRNFFWNWDKISSYTSLSGWTEITYKNRITGEERKELDV